MSVIDLPSPPSVNKPRAVSEEDKARIRSYYTDTPDNQFSLASLAGELGRTKQVISRHARALGLTRRKPHTRATKEAIGNANREAIKRVGHPRGFRGRVHTATARQMISAASKSAWATDKAFSLGRMSKEGRAATSKRMARIASMVPSHKRYTRARGGRRDDLGNTYFRSSWEANYARYLNLLMRLGAVDKWEFEPQTFWFEGVRRGTNSYKPDFRVFYKNDPIPEYIELKGWVVAKDHTKWRRMAKYHPDVKLIIIKAKEYYAIQKKWSSSIPSWETDKGGGRKLGPRVTIVPVASASTQNAEGQRDEPLV